MNPHTIATLLILLTVALILLIAFFTVQIIETVKYNRNTELMNAEAKESQEEFAVLISNLAALNN